MKIQLFGNSEQLLQMAKAKAEYDQCLSPVEQAYFETIKKLGKKGKDNKDKNKGNN